MRTTTWDRELFGDVLGQICKRAQLSQADLAALAGRSRSQINRWTRAENQPAYEAVSLLASNLVTHHPNVAGLARDLMAAAGYNPASALGDDTVESAIDERAESPPGAETIDDLWAAAKQHGKSLGEILVERGLARPEDLSLSDQKRNDPNVADIEALNLPRETKDEMLKAYSMMRRSIFGAAEAASKSREVE